jgi:hypothetical protein
MSETRNISMSFMGLRNGRRWRCRACGRKLRRREWAQVVMIMDTDDFDVGDLYCPICRDCHKAGRDAWLQELSVELAAAILGDSWEVACPPGWCAADLPGGRREDMAYKGAVAAGHLVRGLADLCERAACPAKDLPGAEGFLSHILEEAQRGLAALRRAPAQARPSAAGQEAGKGVRP